MCLPRPAASCAAAGGLARLDEDARRQELVLHVLARLERLFGSRDGRAHSSLLQARIAERGVLRRGALRILALQVVVGAAGEDAFGVREPAFVDCQVAKARRHVRRALGIDAPAAPVGVCGLAELALSHLSEREGKQAEDARVLNGARLLLTGLKIARVAQEGRQVLAIERTARQDLDDSRIWLRAVRPVSQVRGGTPRGCCAPRRPPRSGRPTR